MSGKFSFKKATKSQLKLRLALVGPSGTGKTYTALRVAKGLGSKIAVIDTERGSASKYAGSKFDFDVLELETFSPRTYVDAIHAAEAEGYDVIIIDSLSHAWMGTDGALEQVDKAAARTKGNSFAAWRDVTPMHNGLVDAMLACKAHLIITMRAKTEYVLEEGKNGTKVPRKIGMAPIQRDGMEYEFDVVGDLDYDHRLVVTKTRCDELDGAVIVKPGEEFAATLARWLSDGEPRREEPKTKPAHEPVPDTTVDEMVLVMGSVRSLEEYEPLRERAKEIWSRLSGPQKKSVKDAMARTAERMSAGKAAA